MNDLASFKMISRLRGANVLQFKWDYKMTRYLDRDREKIRARFVRCGNQQIDRVGVFETYTSVISWITVRIHLDLPLTLGMEIQRVDYTNAFCQVPLEQRVFVELIRGSENCRHVLLLLKYVHRLCQSPMNFHKHFRQGLGKRVFTKSNYNDFLSTDESTMILLWVDNCRFYTKDITIIGNIISSLKDILIEREENIVIFWFENK